jgi:hypothetical protein
MEDDNRPMVDVYVLGESESRWLIAFWRILVTPQEVIQDLGFDGMMIPDPIRESSELLPPSLPVIVQRATIQHGRHRKVPLVDS